MNFTNRLKVIQDELNISSDGIFGNETLTAIENLVFGDNWNHAPVHPFRDRFVSITCAEVGTKEEGNNGGERVRQYQSATWLAPSSWPWCAAFVCWCVREAMGKDDLFARPRTAGAWDFENWAKGAHGTVDGVQLIKPFHGDVKAGDIVIFKYSHIGIAVEDDNGETVETVEGNTNASGSREGDGVWRKNSKLSQIRSIIRFN